MHTTTWTKKKKKTKCDLAREREIINDLPCIWSITNETDEKEEKPQNEWHVVGAVQKTTLHRCTLALSHSVSLYAHARARTTSSMQAHLYESASALARIRIWIYAAVRTYEIIPAPEHAHIFPRVLFLASLVARKARLRAFNISPRDDNLLLLAGASDRTGSRHACFFFFYI